MAIHLTTTMELPNEPIATLRAKLDRDDKRLTIREVITFLFGLLAGSMRGFVRTQVASACASATIGCDQSDAVDDTDTVTIAGVELAVVAAPADTSEFAKGADDIEFAANLVDAIHANATLAKLVRATTDGVDTVTVTAIAPGPVGNFLTLTEVGNGFTVSGAVFSGGASDAPYAAELGHVPA